MTFEEIFSLIQKYNLTVRCFPTHIVGFHIYRDGETIKDGDTIKEKVFKNGTRKVVYHEEFREPKWGVKIGDWPHWTKHDFYGTTLEDAVRKAVESLERTTKE